MNIIVKSKRLVIDLLGRNNIIPMRFSMLSLEEYTRLFGKGAVKNKLFYNIGAGLFNHPFWTNVDHYSEYYKDNAIGVDWDLMSKKKLPKKDKSIFVAYTSHTIEHVPDDCVQNLFNEMFRLLKKDGVFRVTCPNILLDFEAYKNNDKNYFYFDDKRKSIQELFVSRFASQLYRNKKINDKEVDSIFKENSFEKAMKLIIRRCSIDEQNNNPGDHINWWTEEKIKTMLSKAGFKDIYLSSFGQSKCPILRDVRYFDNTHPVLSVYVEARK